MASFYEFGAPRAKIPFFFGLVSRSLFVPIVENSSGSKTKFSYRMYCKNQLFAEVELLVMRGSSFAVFAKPWEQLFWFLLPWRWIFEGVPGPQFEVCCW